MKKLVVILFILLSANLSAQYFSMGTDPANVNWRQIKTPVVRLVFDKQMTDEALKLAAFFDSIAPLVSASLNYQPKRVNILLHNHTAIANGFVSWAPRRSEFFTIPTQSNNSNLWLEHLAIHEYRHVVQMSKLNRGLVKFVGYFTAQQAVGAVGGVFLPMWFLEGDAVMTETALSNSGRGRSFDFINPVKAQIIEKQIYPFEKSYLGSFKDHLPNYYQMGYLFSAVNREKYGTELWENAVLNVGRRPLKLHPFYRKTREITGYKKKILFNNTFTYLRDEWLAEIEDQEFTEFEYIIKNNKTNEYIDYQHLRLLNDSIVIAEISGPSTRSNISFVNINTGKEQVVKYIGNRNNEPITVNNKLIAWSEIKPDKRWELKTTSTIYTYNLSTNRTKKLTRKEHFFSPALHPTKELIAAVESTTTNEYFITIINSNNGKILKRTKTPNNFYPITPVWNEKNDEIIVILLSKNGKAFYTLNNDSEIWSKLTNFDFDEKRDPIVENSKILYTAKGAISDEIFELNISTGQISQLTSSKYGARFPTYINNQVVYSQLTANGWKPAIYTDNVGITSSIKNSSVVDKLAKTLTQQEEEINAKKLTPQIDYNVEKYSKWNLFNIHSWAPIYYDINNFEIYAGATLMSQNLLNNTILTAGYNGNPAKKTERYKINLTYKGLYPIFDVDFSYGNEPIELKGIYILDNKLIKANIDSKINHYKLKAGIKLPLTFQKNNYRQLMQLSSKYVLENRKEENFLVEEVENINNIIVPTNQFRTFSTGHLNFNVLEYAFYLSNSRIGTYRDVDLRFRQILSATYRHNPFGNHQSGSIYGISTRLSFPGFGKHDVITLGADYQHKNNGKHYATSNEGRAYYYRANQLVNYPRGFDTLEADNLYILRLNYHHLVWNPEFAIGPIIYIKRVTNQLFTDQMFYDYTQHFWNGNKQKNTHRAASYGTELMSDVHLIQSTLKFKFGARVGIRDTDKKTFGNFLFSFAI